MTYAAGTRVDVASSHAEILRLLAKHGASDYGVTTHAGAATVIFTIGAARVRLSFPLPAHSDVKQPWSVTVWDALTQRRRPLDPARDADVRVDSATTRRLEQATRERWRLVALALKTKLELVALGARTVEQEFLDGLVLPNGRTVARELAETWGSTSPAVLALPPAPPERD